MLEKPLSDDTISYLTTYSINQASSFFEDRRALQSFLKNCSQILNEDGESVGIKKKTQVLYILSNLAVYKPGRTQV